MFPSVGVIALQRLGASENSVKASLQMSANKNYHIPMMHHRIVIILSFFSLYHIIILINALVIEIVTLLTMHS